MHIPSSAPSRTPDALFPLRTTSFERYYLADVRRGYPMTFLLRVELTGELNRQALERAWPQALARHPLLSAFLSRGGEWVAGLGASCLFWDDETPHAGGLDEPVDLCSEPGVRLDVHHQGERAVLTFRFHHAACDGLGGLQLIGDLLACYAAQTGGTTVPAFRSLDPETLLGRGEPNLTLPAPLSRGAFFRAAGDAAWKLATRRPAVLAGTRQQSPERPRDLPVMQLPRQLYEGLRQQARNHGVTVNDLLIRDLFITLRRWNEEHRGRPSSEWLRVIVPTSLRCQRTDLPAANQIGYAMFARRSAGCTDELELLKSLAPETKLAREWWTGAIFNQGLSLLDRVGLLRLVTRFSRKFATAVLSNIGNPIHRFSADLPIEDEQVIAGNVRVEAIYGVPPIRPGTRMSLMLSTYAGELTIACNADPRWFSAEMVNRFLHMYCDRIELTSEREDVDADLPLSTEAPARATSRAVRTASRASAE